jgi:hypothetical protein
VTTAAGSRELVQDDRLRCGDRLHFEFEAIGDPSNDSPASVLHFNVLDLGVAGRIDLFNYRSPAGVEVRDGAPQVLFADRYQRHGFELVWPDDVPLRSGGAAVELHMLVSNAPLDLRSLLRHVPRSGGELATREVRSPRSTVLKPVDWAHARISYTLLP